MNRISAGSLGALAGAVVGLLWVYFGWKLLLILVFGLVGYAAGKLFESEELRAKLRELFSLYMGQ